MAQDLTPLQLSEEDLDRLSEITEQDIVITNNFVVKSVDPQFQNLTLSKDSLLVELEEEEDDTSENQ